MKSRLNHLAFMLLLAAPLAHANLVITPAPPSPTVFVPGQKSPTEFSHPSTTPRANVYLGNSKNQNYSQPQPNNQNHHPHKKHFNYQNRSYSTAIVYPNSVVTTFGPAPVNNTSETVDNQGSWVPAHNGDVPDNALPYAPDNGDNGNDNSNNAFYCRGQYNNQTYDGVLIAGEGCYVDDNANAATIRLQNYEVLLS